MHTYKYTLIREIKPQLCYESWAIFVSFMVISIIFCFVIILESIITLVLLLVSVEIDD